LKLTNKSFEIYTEAKTAIEEVLSMSSFIEKIIGFFKESKSTGKHIPTIFTLAGCSRCRIVKEYMKDHEIPYLEKDAGAPGKQDFHQFHMENFDTLTHGPRGCISFPIYVNKTIIHQGISNVLAYLTSEDRLAGFFNVGYMVGWIDGIHVSGGNPEYAEEFLAILRYLKGNSINLQIDTNGKNSKILKQVLDEGLADSVIMDVLGPRTLYSEILGEEISLDEVEKSMVLLTKFPKYQFQTTILPVNRHEEGSPAVSYLTIKEVEETALFIKEATDSMKEPYLLKRFDPEETDQDLETGELLDFNKLFPYRSGARKHQVFTEIEPEQP